MRERGTPGALALVVGVVLVLLLAFVGKAYTIDDTLFLFLGKHLQSSPWDFYGFEVNWYGTSEPMYTITKNPPLTGYYIAGAAWLFGWSEVALHLAFLLPAALAAAGTFLLARRFCASPVEASLIGLLTPVFLVSGTNVMCDTTMVALWCWALLAWMRGVDQNRIPLLLAGALLAGLAALTKYFAMALLPLFAAYAVMRIRWPADGPARAGTPRPVGSRWAWGLCLLPAVAMLAWYQGYTAAHYDRGLLLDAAEYATDFGQRRGNSFLARGLVGLMFAGGCLVPALFYAPLLWKRRTLAIAMGSTSFVIAVAVAIDAVGRSQIGIGRTTELHTLIQFMLFAAAGVSVVGLALADPWKRRDPDSFLLSLWVLGTIVFAAFVNWVDNGRSNLPMAPALGILIVRRLELRGVPAGGLRTAAFVPGVLIALAVTWADCRWANSARTAAEDIMASYGSAERTTYFQGHWGFQYYMDQLGARAQDLDRDTIPQGAILVFPDPENNTEINVPMDEAVKLIEEREYPGSTWVHTMAPRAGAGFYASNIGSIPFAFGPADPDLYRIMRARRNFRVVDWR